MKERSKQVLKSSAALLLVSSVALTGCSKSGTKDGGATTAPTTPAATVEASKAPALAPYTVSLRYPGTPQKDEQAVEEAINKILTKKINATIDLQPIDWGAWEDKLNLMFSSNEKADLVFTASWQNHGQYVHKGAFLALDDLLVKHGKDIQKSLDPAFLKGVQIDGKTYGIATNKEIASNTGILMRKDLVDKYKFDLTKVKSMADLEPIFNTIKENEKGVIPFYVMESIMPAQYFSDFDSAGDVTVPGVLLKSGTDTKFKDQFEFPGFVENIKLTYKWAQSGIINKDAATTKTTPEEMIKAGKAFAYVSGLKPGKDKEVEGNVKVPMLQLDITKPTTTTGDTTGSMLAISKTSKDPDRAMMVLNLLHSDKELLNLVVYGIEGTHYKKVSDNVIEDMNRDGYNPGNNWMIGNQFLNYLGKNEDPQKWEKFKAFNASAIKSPALGFLFNGESVKNEMAQITNINKQYFNAILTGSVNPDEIIPQYQEKLIKAGRDKVIAEKQKQFDEFLKNKK